MKLFKVYPTDGRYDGYLTVAADSKSQAKVFVEKYIRTQFMYSAANEHYAFCDPKPGTDFEPTVHMDNIFEIGYATYNENAQNIDVFYRNSEDKEVICDNCIYDSWDS